MNAGSENAFTSLYITWITTEHYDSETDRHTHEKDNNQKIQTDKVSDKITVL